MSSFICPECRIPQDDLYVQEGWLFDAPDEPVVWYRCNSCGVKLLPSEVGDFDRRYRRRELAAHVGGVVVWIIVIAAVVCWLT